MDKTSKTLGIFLDDERNPEDVTWIDYPDSIEWIVVRNRSQFNIVVHTLLLKGIYDVSCIAPKIIISFDHDIQCFEECDEGCHEVTGYHLLKWMVDSIMDEELIPPTCYFHTKNPVGKSNMENYWRNFLTVYH